MRRQTQVNRRSALDVGIVRKSVSDSSTPLRMDKNNARLRLNLIGSVAGSHGLIRVGLSRRARSSRFDSRDVCLSRANCLFLGLAGFVQFVVEFIFCFLKFADGLSHSPRQFWQFLCPEKDKDNQQYNNQIWPRQIHKAREQAHNMCLNIRLSVKVAR